MFPWLLIFYGLAFAAFLLLTVVPPMFIYNPAKHPGESHGPPTADVIIQPDSLSHSAKQKLYILFVLPACGVCNAILLYIFYYRHVRYALYRVEASALANTRLATTALGALRQHASNPDTIAGMLGNRSLSGIPSQSVLLGQTLATGSGASPGPAGDGVEKYQLQAARELINKVHIRPRNLDADSATSTPIFPELRSLLLPGVNKFLQRADKTREEISSYIVLLDEVTGEEGVIATQRLASALDFKESAVYRKSSTLVMVGPRQSQSGKTKSGSEKNSFLGDSHTDHHHYHHHNHNGQKSHEDTKSFE